MQLTHPNFGQNGLWYYNERNDAIVEGSFTPATSARVQANAIIRTAGLVGVTGGYFLVGENIRKSDIIGRIDPL